MSKEKKLLGYRRFTSKKNVPLCIATVGTKCDAKDNERGSFGLTAEDVFLPQELYGYLEITDIGKPVTLNYNVIGGRAFINDFMVDRSEASTVKK